MVHSPTTRHDGPGPSLPIADPWFASTRFDDGVTLVSEPHVHPLLRCNVWHVSGRDRDLVVDTALGLAPLRPVLDTGIDHPVLAVATHGHGDHTGGLAEFDQRAIHRAESDTVDGPIQLRLRAADYPDTVLDPYTDAGWSIPEVLVDARPPGPAAWTLDPVVGPAPATRLLDGGDVIDLGDRVFEVLHLPGHSPGSIGLWEAASGTLFAGDAAYDGPLLDRLDGSDPDAYRATMERLRALPVAVVHGGHETSFGRDRLVELCDAYLAGRPWPRPTDG